MATEAKKNPLDALSLLVDAANAQSSAPQQSAEAEAAEANKSAPTAENVPSSVGNANNGAAAAAAQQRSVEMELREALHRQAMEREALEGEAMLQQRAALMSAGLGGMGGGGFQETEYMQQLRLEALVQQHRQETLAQLAMAQEYNPEAQALIAAQLRQHAMMREQELMMASGGMANMDHMASMDQMAAALRQREGARNENALLRLFEERDRQHKMAAMGGAAPAPVTSIDVMAVQPPAAVAAMPMNPPTKAKDDSAFALAGSKVTVLPCRARGMPMDHNAKTAYFVVPEDVKHGAELVCSYDQCRNAGIKFRYCVFCSLPVAKRNFFKKHKHEGKIPPDRLGDGIPKEDEMPQQDEPPQKTTFRKWNTKELLLRAMASNSGLGKPDGLKKAISSGEMAQLVEIRKRKWEKLLDTRPLAQSETEMVLWVRKVLNVSDLTPPKAIKEKEQPAFLIKKEEEKKVEEKKVEEKKNQEKKEEEKPDVPKEVQGEKISAGESTDEDEEEDGNSSKDEDKDEVADDDMEGDAPAEEEKEDGNVSDGSASSSGSSSGSSVDLRAHKRAKTAE
ncbi:MAG: hypothetical protein SGBAC_000856 [Bacillariaceae sp.]